MWLGLKGGYMSIEQTGVVDAIGVDKQTGEVVLTSY